jgi:hypothetical protein
MPEAKNTFLKAKMNQDLDDRLLPNGEYRSAQNILVGKSEEDSVGALENIKGNELIAATDLGDFSPYGPAFIIGFLMDDTNNRIYTFLTNWTESGDAPSDAHCSIRYLDANNTQNYVTLVEGSFLNFSIQNNIIGINLLEDLLFWTDNRNQPRKINVRRAAENPNYYNQEHHISVAKYNPYQPISLIKEEVEDVVSIASTTVFDIPENIKVVAGMTVLGVNSSGSTTILPNEYITVDSAVPSSTPGQTTITISDAPAVAIAPTDTIYFLLSTMTDKSDVSTWPGDPDYLEDKFVRFAYRFKFDDNEYSIFSPFTQIAFIPKQKGYFINGQEENAVRSTIVDWFENGINDIELIIPLPDVGTSIDNTYKIKAIDILYKESDQIPVKVIDTIPVSEIKETSDNFYIYSYQSRKPIRTLPEAQTVRVYDKVPVKAKTQEVVSNRVVYGNFQTKHTAPNTINYNINVQNKIGSGQYPNFIEYPNHTVKQNRNYQVGFVLSDKFGRQSDVILSPVGANAQSVGGVLFAGSTIYAEYIQDEPEGSGNVDPGYMPNGVIDWFGNSLVMAVNSPIVSIAGAGGAPGLYAEENSRFDLVPQEINGIPTNVEASFSYNGTLDEWEYTFEVYKTTCDASFSSNTDIPQEGDYLRAAHIDYTKVESVIDNGATTYGHSYTVRTKEKLNDLYLSSGDSVCTNISPASYIADTKFTYNINTLGWYSYKIVVKQVEQEYYNVYLPSAIAADGFIPNSTDTDDSVSYITLINDNINKVPRDLAEVGPDQKQYRSSVKLYGRVNPTYNATGPVFGNTQFYPIRSSDISTSVGNTNDLLGTSIASNPDPIFQYDSDPILARVSTEEQFGINYNDFGTTRIADRFQLAVYETDPVVSNLDIYWETAEAGLISDLNWDIAVGYDGPVTFQDPAFEFEEQDIANTNLTQDFLPLNNLGAVLSTTVLGGYTVTNGDGIDVTTDFLVAQRGTGEYYIQNKVPFTYTFGADDRENYTFEITINDAVPASSWTSATLTVTGSLINNPPSYDLPSPPYYYFNDTFVTGQLIHDFSTNANVANGSATNITAGLKWEIVSGNSAGYFTWDNNPSATYSTTGRLTLAAAGLNAPIGSYPLGIKLTDASSSGSEDPDSEAVTKTPIIVKGWPRSSSGEGQGTGEEDYLDYGDNRDYVYAYYASNSTLTSSDMPSVSFGSDNGISKTDFDNTPEKLGNTLTEGELVFEIEQWVTHDPEITVSSPVMASFDITTFHRATPANAWSEVKDINNNNVHSYVFTNDPNDLRDTSSNATAHGTPGEYVFIVSVSAAVSSFGDEDPLIWNFDPYLKDLHYYGYGQVQEVYEYDLYTVGGNGYTTLTGVGDTSLPSGPVHTVYSEVPLGEYVRTFYVDSSLTNIYNTTSTPAIGTADRYYPFKLGGGNSRTRYPSFANVFGPGSTENIWFEVKLDSSGEKDESSTSYYTASYQNSLVYPNGWYLN